ncbi:MAG: phage tail protein [Fluviicola sp.]
MEPFLGQIQPFGFNFAPRGWAFCEGQLLPISANTALFSLLGTIYGGDGRTTFALPDLRGRVAIHHGHGPGLSSYRIGQRGGSEVNYLTIPQLPSHNHAAAGTLKAYFQPPTGGGSTNNPNGASLSGSAGTNIYSNQAENVNLNANNVTVTVGNTGGSQGVNNIQPYLAVSWCIALVGIFPSRS